MTPLVRPRPLMSARRLERLSSHLNGQPLMRIFLSQNAVANHGYVRDPNLTSRKNLQAYDAHQIDHVDELMAPHGVFPAVRFLNDLRRFHMPPGYEDMTLIEFHVASENRYESGERLERFLNHHEIPIVTSQFTEGDSPLGRVNLIGGHVFFSGKSYGYDEIDGKVPALRVLPVPADPDAPCDQYAFIWDWDATVAFQISEAIFQTKGVRGFRANEVFERANPMDFGPAGPLFVSALLLRALFEDEGKQESPIINMILTARDAEAAQRIRSTIKSWRKGLPYPVSIDDYAAVEGRRKGPFIQELIAAGLVRNGRRIQAILLDDSGKYAQGTAELGIPAVVVPTSARP